ncbi:hypothetical protein BKA58DRAFT_440510 [Alternaria rosae]|uniref:uncharacterized protein n=1 Tax=Alternaria rosae TaxID=1187941 RepID=UPI001E8DE5DE|nr:uncharacterized protein BKA58DRAFT_440510 [Alternaria rosae]KAH6868048.1 hypothetical protein BKA58DRAFT_440510 [Alternaria rosae]
MSVRRIHAGRLNRLLFAVMFLMLVMPASALDEPQALSPSAAAAAAGYYYHPRYPIGFFISLLFFIGQSFASFSSTLVGPAMGITSVLWLMLRNDSAISPRASWMVFGIWSWLTAMYFLVQCQRVSNHRLYILVTIAIASTCMGLVAMAQKSSLQGGLVTAIPTCTSFAAYVVAYCFPDGRRREPDAGERITMV